MPPPPLVKTLERQNLVRPVSTARYDRARAAVYGVTRLSGHPGTNLIIFQAESVPLADSSGAIPR